VNWYKRTEWIIAIIFICLSAIALKVFAFQPPLLSDAEVNGSQLVLIFDDNLYDNNINSPVDITVNGSASGTCYGNSVIFQGVTLTVDLVSCTILGGEELTVSYTNGGWIRDPDQRVTEAFTDLPVRNLTVDTTPPAVVNATGAATAITINFNEELSAGSVPANSDFVVSVNNLESPVTNVVIDGTLLTLTVSDYISFGLSTHVAFTFSENHIQDPYGNNLDFFDVYADTSDAPDVDPPVPQITSPLANAVVSGSSVSLSATASDNQGVIGVQFKLDSTTNIGTEDTSNPYARTWDSTAVSDGSHTISAVAHDADGNYATSTITVTVSNTDPVVIVEEDDDSHHRSGSRRRLNDAPIVEETFESPAEMKIESESEVYANATEYVAATLGINTDEAERMRTNPVKDTVFGAFQFLSDLGVGDRGTDVFVLQRFLNARGFFVADTGAGSPNEETTYYATRTKTALSNFQKNVGITSTGFFGEITRQFVNELLQLMDK
jgi:hypothetical protein